MKRFFVQYRWRWLYFLTFTGVMLVLIARSPTIKDELPAGFYMMALFVIGAAICIPVASDFWGTRADKLFAWAAKRVHPLVTLACMIGLLVLSLVLTMVGESAPTKAVASVMIMGFLFWIFFPMGYLCVQALKGQRHA